MEGFAWKEPVERTEIGIDLRILHEKCDRVLEVWVSTVHQIQTKLRMLVQRIFHQARLAEVTSRLQAARILCRTRRHRAGVKRDRNIELFSEREIRIILRIAQ